jgi:hypothetical protein
MAAKKKRPGRRPIKKKKASTDDLSASPLVTQSPEIGSPALHARMIEQIEAIEPELDSLLNRIGHNKPPEPIEIEPPLNAKELGEIKKAMADLKKEPPAPNAPSAKAEAAVELLKKFGNRLLTYVGKQADNLVTEAVKEAGKRIVQAPFWLPIINKLPALADTAQQWLQSLGPH